MLELTKKLTLSVYFAVLKRPSGHLGGNTQGWLLATLSKEMFGKVLPHNELTILLEAVRTAAEQGRLNLTTNHIGQVTGLTVAEQIDLSEVDTQTLSEIVTVDEAYELLHSSYGREAQLRADLELTRSDQQAALNMADEMEAANNRLTDELTALRAAGACVETPDQVLRDQLAALERAVKVQAKKLEATLAREKRVRELLQTERTEHKRTQKALTGAGRELRDMNTAFEAANEAIAVQSGTIIANILSHLRNEGYPVEQLDTYWQCDAAEVCDLPA